MAKQKKTDEQKKAEAADKLTRHSDMWVRDCENCGKLASDAEKESLGQFIQDIAQQAMARIFGKTASVDPFKMTKKKK